MKIKLIMSLLAILLFNSCITGIYTSSVNKESFSEIEFVKDIFSENLQEIIDHNKNLIGFYERINNKHSIIKTKGIKIYDLNKNELYSILPDAEGSTTTIHFKDSLDNKGYLKITPKMKLVLSFDIDLKFLSNNYLFEIKKMNSIIKYKDEIIYFQEPIINGDYKDFSINKVDFLTSYLDSNISDAILWGGILILANELGQESSSKQQIIIQNNYHN